ncbi:MAG: hypothetical protein OER88_12045 [Planctomycetota bacterium]|nr:hypothetical protein [Planctomycetota bacterium]
MRELRRLMLAVLVLTFLGGVGTGAWIGSLAAKPAGTPGPNPERRIQDWQQAFPDLTATQIRQIRTILSRHDRAVGEIRQRVSARQWREQRAQEDSSREELRQVLNEEQRRKYNRIVRGRDMPEKGK